MDKFLNNVIFLLGTGASADAGMPTVAGLTCELKKRLPVIRDEFGNCHPEFARVFNLFEDSNPKGESDYLDPDNYEHFFRWIESILEIRKRPYEKIFGEIKIDPSLPAAMSMIKWMVKNVITIVLDEKTPKTPPEYLKKFKKFLNPY